MCVYVRKLPCGAVKNSPRPLAVSLSLFVRGLTLSQNIRHAGETGIRGFRGTFLRRRNENKKDETIRAA